MTDILDLLDDRAQVSDDQDQVAQLEADLAIISQANSTLTTIASQNIPDIVGRLGSFNVIWSSVATELSAVNGYLQIFYNGVEVSHRDQCRHRSRSDVILPLVDKSSVFPSGECRSCTGLVYFACSSLEQRKFHPL